MTGSVLLAIGASPGAASSGLVVRFVAGIAGTPTTPAAAAPAAHP